VVVTIVDSGVDIDNHGAIFGTNSLQGTGPGCLQFGPYGTDLTDGDGIPNDETGHGTAVASTVISGYNSNRPLTVINNKFFNNDGGSLFNGLCAGYTGVAAGSHIVNLSWGFQSTEEPAAVKTFLEHAKNREVVIVASAGNGGQFINDFFYWPALFGNQYDNMLTVASYENPTGIPPARTSWTNYSPFDVQVAAFYARQCLQLGGGEWYPAGTSISAPLVTGQLAILKAVHFSDNADQLVNRFLTNGLLNTSPSLDDTTVGGLFLGIPDPDNNCIPFKEDF
jgi:subtilisin family serine protease